jgi:hypothetical protein
MSAAPSPEPIGADSGEPPVPGHQQRRPNGRRAASRAWTG